MAELETTVIHAIHESKTIKIKLSGESEKDIRAIQLLEKKFNRHKIQIRLDANQGFSTHEAKKFFDFLSTSSVLSFIDYVEQPFNYKDWDSHEKFKKMYRSIEIMLDESIIVKNDITRANNIGIKYIKLKLFKQGGIKELISLAQYAHNMGIKTVIGNGVATKISNNIENSIYYNFRNYFYGDSEANGFLKITEGPSFMNLSNFDLI